MTFLLPLGLLALLTLPLILVLHLLRERRRRVAVPSLLHWLDVPRRREGERIRRLPLTLLLLLHLLVAGLLGLALAHPQLFGALGNTAHQTIIVLDTSTSMAARAGVTTRFTQAQEQARALLRGMRAGDRATLIVAGHSARVVATGGAGDQASLSAALDGLRPGGTNADLAGALTLAEAELVPQLAHQIVVLTDGAQTPPATRRMAAPLDWRQVGDNQPNRAIIAFASRPWGDKQQVYARVANYSPAPFATKLRLYGDERLLDTRDVNIATDGETELTWTLPAGPATLRAEIDGEDALPQDDQGFLDSAPPRPINVLLVSAKPDALRRALSAAPGVKVVVIEPARYADETTNRSAADLTVFDGFLPVEWPAGAILAINPPPSSTLLPKAAPPISLTGELVQRGAVLEGLSLGGVNFGSVQSIESPAWAETQLAIGDTPLIVRGRNGANEIATWTFDLATSNLPTRLAFPLLVARTVRDLAPAQPPPSIQAGLPLMFRPDSRATMVELTAADGARSAVPATPLLTIDTLTQPGFYRVEERNGDRPIFARQVGVNAGAAGESDLRPQATPQFESVAQTAGDARREMLDLWPWLALGALALLMLEWGYIHR